MFNLSFKNINKEVYSLMINGLKFSTIILVVALYILLLYKFYPISHVLFASGLLLFKAGLMFATSFFICGFVFNSLLTNN